MATYTPADKEHLEWCLYRALLEFDVGNKTNAVASIISDFREHITTQDISPTLIIGVVGPAVEMSREDFVDAVMGFSV